MAHNQRASQVHTAVHSTDCRVTLVLLNSIEKCLLDLTRTDLILDPEISPQTR